MAHYNNSLSFFSEVPQKYRITRVKHCNSNTEGFFFLENISEIQYKTMKSFINCKTSC